MKRLDSFYRNLIVSTMLATVMGCDPDCLERKQEVTIDKRPGFLQVKVESCNYLSFRAQQGNCDLQVISRTEKIRYIDFACDGTVDGLLIGGEQSLGEQLLYRVPESDLFIKIDHLYARSKEKIAIAAGVDLDRLIRQL